MLTQFGINSIISSISDKIISLNYYISGVKYTLNINSSDIQNSVLSKTVTFSGIDGTINKIELLDHSGNVLGIRNDNIALTSSKDLIVRFQFNVSEI